MLSDENKRTDERMLWSAKEIKWKTIALSARTEISEGEAPHVSCK